MFSMWRAVSWRRISITTSLAWAPLQRLTFSKKLFSFQNSRSAKIFCLCHKMDLIPEDQRDQVQPKTPATHAKVFREREAELRRRSNPMDITCFRTSIWDETLYKVCHRFLRLWTIAFGLLFVRFSYVKAWSSIVVTLIPNVGILQSQLDDFSSILDADEVSYLSEAFSKSLTFS